MNTKRFVRQSAHSNLVVELDKSQVFPDDPGAGTPAMVYLDTSKGRHSATYWCAIGEGEVENNHTGEMKQLTEKQLEWLEVLNSEIDNFLFGTNK
jgi:hypothetical protein